MRRTSYVAFWLAKSDFKGIGSTFSMKRVLAVGRDRPLAGPQADRPAKTAFRIFDSAVKLLRLRALVVLRAIVLVRAAHCGAAYQQLVSTTPFAVLQGKDRFELERPML